jgi:type II secretory ATPase GspE/PulE/Tfp pilus assembly ATPase PilB-like protein/ActR/RegA family two-component response regulator
MERVAEEGATHLVIEPSGEGCVARATIGGKGVDLREFPLRTGKQLVTRFKALSGMDLAKRRQRQVGSINAILNNCTLKLRLSTAADLVFENLIIRVLDPGMNAGSLESLGLSEKQAGTLRGLAARDRGLILFVGPLGSGKTTTVYSLLSELATPERRLVTVEDPIEHRIPFADQQEVGPEVGKRMLLQYAVNQDPDVLFLSEIRGLSSAQACVDFTNAGHLTISSMTSSNAATAVFRLERLGVDRASVADALAGIVAQRLLRRLCPECRAIKPISEEERVLLERFTQEVPENVASPVGCSHCGGSGYQGEVAMFEVIPVTPGMSDLIREGRPIGELRAFARSQGDFLLGDHALEAVRRHAVAVADAYRGVLLEESGPAPVVGAKVVETAPPDGETAPSAAGADPEGVVDSSGDAEPVAADPDEKAIPARIRESTILVVEDEISTRILIEEILAKAGYQVLAAADGAEALLLVGTQPISLILSDIHMPNLDGLKLLEVLAQHDIGTPVVFLTAEPSPEMEARGREMGAADYLRKPVQRDLLLKSLWNVLGGEEGGDGGTGSKPFLSSSDSGMAKKRDPRRRY